MRPDINFQALMDLVKANEDSKDFDLSRWKCGTYGCLVGNYGLKYDEEFLEAVRNSVVEFKLIAQAFGISEMEAKYLFHSIAHIHINHTMFLPQYGYQCLGNLNRDYHDKEGALNRVRKFIYYHLKKREFCLDDNGVTETSKQVGDVNFANQVLCEV
jgi:hypothetical protein